MSEDAALEDLRRFLLEQIATYEELDVLLRLAREPGRNWSATSVAQALGVSAEECRDALEKLAGRGLLTASEDTDTFRYSPASEEMATSVEILDHAYRERRATVVMMMSTNAMERVRSSAIRTFAEAFRIRGPKK